MFANNNKKKMAEFMFYIFKYTHFVSIMYVECFGIF